MKSKFFKFNAKVALMSLALIGLLAGCKNDDNDAPTPDAEKPMYEVQATITDFATKAALPGATVKVGDKTGTTDAKGKCTVEAVSGKNTVTVSKDKYETYTTEVNIAAVESGKGIGNAEIALKPGKNDPTYKTVQYNIEATTVDADGKAVTVKSAYSPSILASKLAIKDNVITITDIKPGSYSVTVNADGYSPAVNEIIVTEIKGEEGAETEIQINVTKSTIKMIKKEVAAPTYSINGTVTDQTGKVISATQVKASIGGTLIGNVATNSKGEYVLEVPAASIAKDGSIVTLKVEETPVYNSAVATGKLYVITTGSSNVTANLILTLKEIKVEEDGSQAGAGNLEIPVEDTKVGEIENVIPEKPASKEQISNALTEQLKETGTTKEEIAAVTDIIEKMQRENKIENVTKVAVVPVATETKITVTSQVVETPTEGGDATVTKQSDEVTIPQGSVIVFPTGTAQNITIARDLVAEKVAASERVYEGKPSGTAFTRPMVIQFEAPVKSDDVQFSILYFNEQKGTWEADANNYATFKNGKFEGSIKHFSKIKFGFETAKEQDGTAKEEAYEARPCFTGGASAVAHVTLKAALTGSRFTKGTAAEIVKVALPGVAEETLTYVTKLLNELILSGNSNILPTGNKFGTMEYKADITIPAYAQVEGFNITYNKETTNYTVTVINKTGKEVTIIVPVERITGTSIESKHTISHGHGHGHGSDLNAGGGIIDFE